LGVKSGDKIGTPILVPFSGQVKEVACGVFYTLVLTEEGDVYGMGNNKYAQLGLGHKINEPKPTLIHELGNIVKVEAGYHSGALNSMC
jgi:alpha-tubulin suppressor-like RCC1 family protein